MRFDREKWLSLPVPERIQYSWRCVLDRAARVSGALDAGGVPHAVCGGLAVMAWVDTRDPGRSRTTKDVDLLLRRADLARAAIVLEPHGFVQAEVNGITMFLDGADGLPSDAVHLVIAGERPSPHAPAAVPDLGDVVRDAMVPWPRTSIATLVEMKLLAMRPHDIAHLGDLLRVGLLERSLCGQIRPELHARFDRAMDEAERHYGGSSH